MPLPPRAPLAIVLLCSWLGLAALCACSHGPRRVRGAEDAGQPEAAETTGPNLIQNPSFEALDAQLPDSPLHWQAKHWGELTADFALVDDAHSGKHAARVALTQRSSGDAKWVFDAVPVSAGARFMYRDAYRSDVATRLVAALQLDDGSTSYQSLIALPPSAAWADAMASLVAPPHCTALSIYHLIETEGSLQLDDASLVELPALRLVNGVPNGDLELPAYPGADLPAGFRTSHSGEHDARFGYGKSGRNGSRGVELTVTAYTSGQSAWYYDPQPIDPTQVFELSAYYRADVDTLFHAELTHADGTTSNLRLPVAFAAADWTRFATHVRVPSTVRALSVQHGLARVGSLHVDDVGLQSTPGRGFKRALASLAFDDGWSSVFVRALPVLDQHHTRATYYVISSLIGQMDRLDLDMLQALHDRGHQIAAHTATHRDLTTLDAAALHDELSTGQSALEALGYGAVRDFASPFGSYGTASLAAIRALFDSHRTTDDGFNAAEDFDRYRLKCQVIRSTTKPEDVERWVARAADEHTWLILLYHDISDTPGDYGTSAANLDAHLQSLEQHGMPVVTVREALDEVGAQLP